MARDGRLTSSSQTSTSSGNARASRSGSCSATSSDSHSDRTEDGESVAALHATLDLWAAGEVVTGESVVSFLISHANETGARRGLTRAQAIVVCEQLLTRRMLCSVNKAAAAAAAAATTTTTTTTTTAVFTDSARALFRVNSPGAHTSSDGDDDDDDADDGDSGGDGGGDGNGWRAELLPRRVRSPADVELHPSDAANRALLANAHPPEHKDPEPAPVYDLVVLGGGTGGLVSAIAASKFGARVALVEARLLGGDCLNFGCVPSKTLLAAAHAVSAVRRARELGVRVDGEVTVDFAAVMQRVRDVRAVISDDDSAHRLAALGVDVFLGRGAFVSPRVVRVNGHELRFARACVATGGRAFVPPLEGLAEVGPLTNETIFNLTALPARLCVMGTGAIACELAQAFAVLGSQVTVCGRSLHVLPREEPAAAALLQAQLTADGVQFALGISYERVSRRADGSKALVVRDADGASRRIGFDEILVATGRVPTVDGLGLELAGVAFDRERGVRVDDHLRTTNKRVFACGDVAGQLQFTHMADAMARIVVRNALFYGSAKVSALVVPWATYTQPEVAHVGAFARELDEAGIAYTLFTRPLAHNDRALCEGDSTGFISALVSPKGHVLGATVVAAHAGELIGEFTIAMRHKLTLAALGDVVHAYPTVGFEIKRLGDDAALARIGSTATKVLRKMAVSHR